MNGRCFGHVGAWLVAVVFVGIANGDPIPVAPPPREVWIEELVRRLGSEDYQEREDATKKLASLNLPEPPLVLLRALESPSPEVRLRADEAIRAIRVRATNSMLKTGRAFASKGRIDLLVAATASWKLNAEDDRLWQPALDLASMVVKKAEFAWWPPAACPNGFGSVAGFRESFHPRFIRSDQPHQHEKLRRAGDPQSYYPSGIMTPGVSSPLGLVDNIIVSRGDVGPVARIDYSVVYANGDVTVVGYLANTILICDGDVTIEDHISNALVVARGNIRAGSFATGSTLVVGGTIKCGLPNPAEKKVANVGKENLGPPPIKGMFVGRADKRFANVIEEKQTNPLGFITFFELSRIGLEVKVADGAVKVAAIAAGKPSEKAGVKVGDIILEVNGKKPTDAESLRRLLRDALAIADATVKLQRGDKTETLKVALPE
ncbi:MAG: PDZ domain-containing protein [Planctomycetia bacterium]|nr:PDZ domain-containing protein [Planctomycetia bacterium]